jgi:hypothetical protein
MWLLLLLILVTPPGDGQQSSPQKVQRLPLQKKGIVLQSPTHYEKWLMGSDPKTGQEIYHDPRPRVELVDAKSGKYALKWIGTDGKERTLIYQRPDAIDAIVSASVSKTPSGRYLYIYSIQNLPSSGQYLGGIAVQNFASDARPVGMRIEDVYAGPMSNNKEMREGNWVGFGILKPIVVPGRSIQLSLESSGPPGLVECYIRGGYQGMISAVGEPPPELMDVLPGYEAWPHGYTIGPVENLKALSSGKRAEYIRQRLAQFKKLGWMTADVVPWYEQALKGGDLEKIYHRAEQDLKAGKITTEVMGMIRYTLRRE